MSEKLEDLRIEMNKRINELDKTIGSRLAEAKKQELKYWIKRIREKLRGSE